VDVMDLQEFAPVGGRTALLTIAAVVAVTVLSDACSQSPVGIHPPTHSSSTLAGRDEAVWRSMIADETHLAAADIPMTVFGSRWMLARVRQGDGMAIILPTHRRDSRADRTPRGGDGFTCWALLNPCANQHGRPIDVS
jgi:hypothetical protein